MRETRADLPRYDGVTKAINYFLNDWECCTIFLAQRPDLLDQKLRRAQASRRGVGGKTLPPVEREAVSARQ